MPGITLQGTGAWKTQKSRMRHTLDTLVRDLRALGLVPGDVERLVSGLFVPLARPLGNLEASLVCYQAGPGDGERACRPQAGFGDM